MKVGDLVRFKKSHWSRGGYDYCAKWRGLITQVKPTTIYWTTEYGDTTISERRIDDLVSEVEVINESH